jgi:hypothetical protein
MNNYGAHWPDMPLPNIKYQPNVNETWFQTFAVFLVLYSFFWMIPRRLNFMYRRFGTLCLIFIGGASRKNKRDEIDSVPKRQHIKSRCRGNTQKKECNVKETSCIKICIPVKRNDRVISYRKSLLLSWWCRTGIPRSVSKRNMEVLTKQT